MELLATKREPLDSLAGLFAARSPLARAPAAAPRLRSPARSPQTRIRGSRRFPPKTASCRSALTPHHCTEDRPSSARTRVRDVNALSFTGREWNPATGQYYNRARVLQTGTDRWLTRDPRFDFEHPHYYLYAANDPVGKIDPKGESIASLVALSVATIGVAWGAGKYAYNNEEPLLRGYADLKYLFSGGIGWLKTNKASLQLRMAGVWLDSPAFLYRENWAILGYIIGESVCTRVRPDQGPPWMIRVNDAQLASITLNVPAAGAIVLFHEFTHIMEKTTDNRVVGEKAYQAFSERDVLSWEESANPTVRYTLDAQRLQGLGK